MTRGLKGSATVPGWRLISLALLAAACQQERAAGDEPVPEPKSAVTPAEPVAPPPPPPPRAVTATVVRKGSRGDFTRERDVELPEGAAVRAKRIVEDDGGYLDLFRSSDGRVLWASRGYDDGTSKNWQFTLQADRSGWGDAVLQFVDNVTERREQPSTTTWDEEMGESETGPYRLLAEAWLVSAQARMALRPPSGAPVPLVHAGRGPGDPSRLQWMVFFEQCPEVAKACVYFGAPKDVARRVDAAALKRGDGSQPLDLWIYPAQ